MKKSDLRNGDVVQIQNGNFYLYMQDGIGGTFIGLSSEANIMSSGSFDDELRVDYDGSYDVSKVYRGALCGDALRSFVEDPDHAVPGRYHLVFTRPRKMTVAEISEALGHEVEVVEE